MTRDLCCVITDCPAVGRWKKTMSSMLRSGKDQNNEHSESNWTLWYNFPLNYSQVLQVVSTFRAGSTVPTSAVWTTAAISCSDNLEQLVTAMRSRHSTRLGSRINTYCVGHADGTWKGSLVFQSNWATGLPQTGNPYKSVACKATSHHRYLMNYYHHRLLPKWIMCERMSIMLH